MTTRSPHDGPPQVLAIDLVRFACALLVVAHHWLAMLPIRPPAELAGAVGAHSLSRAQAGWSWAGWIGVEIFFVVSGYVIAISATHGDGLSFLRRRALRLAPAAWASASITALVLALTVTTPAADLAGRWAASMTFWPIATQIDAPYWTLGIEIAFYLLVAIRLGGRDTIANIERLALFLALASFGWWSAVTASLVGGQSGRSIDLLLLPHGCFFAIGIALRAVRTAGWDIRRSATILIGLAAGCTEITQEAQFMARGLGLTAGPILPLAEFALALACIAGADRLHAPLARWIGAGPLAWAGRATYPLYLLHCNVGSVVIVALMSAGYSLWVAVAAASIAVLALTTLVVAVFEPALRVRLAVLLSRRDPAPDIPRTASLPAG